LKKDDVGHGAPEFPRIESPAEKKAEEKGIKVHLVLVKADQRISARSCWSDACGY